MTRIAIALTPDFADWESALLSAVARSYLGAEIMTASPDGAPVTSMGGLKVMPDVAYGALDPASIDALIVPGGLSWESGSAPDFTEMVQRFRREGRVVAGICAAASMLGGTGILNDVAHTGNSLTSHQAYPAYTGTDYYRDQPQAVSDKGVVTADGTAPISFTMEVLKALDLWGPEAEAEIKAFAAEHR
jgi:putative intracellular protease/amidase